MAITTRMTVAPIPRREEPTLLVGRFDRIDYPKGGRSRKKGKKTMHAVRLRIPRLQDGPTGCETVQNTRYGTLGSFATALGVTAPFEAGRSPLEVPAVCRVPLGYFNLQKELEQSGCRTSRNGIRPRVDEGRHETASARIHQLFQGKFWPPLTPRAGILRGLWPPSCLDNVVGGVRPWPMTEREARQSGGRLCPPVDSGLGR